MNTKAIRGAWVLRCLGVVLWGGFSATAIAKPAATQKPAIAMPSKQAIAQTHTGRIQVAGPAKIAGGPKVWLRIEDGMRFELLGVLRSELERLQSAEVMAIGLAEEQRFWVQRYQILDVGGGAKPWVGTLVQEDATWALADGDGSPIPLTLRARTQARLAKHEGAKVWVYGRRLVSGSIRVSRYGILRRSVQPSNPAQDRQK